MTGASGTMTGLVVVITGGSSGIGAAMAREFVRRGAIVVVAARSTAKLQGLAQDLGDRCSFEQLDVTSNESVESCVRMLNSRYGRIDVWINNAGFGVFESFLEAELERFESMMDVNYMGTVRCTKAVLPLMLAAGSGQIVNIASLAGKMGSAKGSGYCASKHAVLGFTNSLRQELRGTGITVTAVNPGPIDTPFFEQADPGGQYVENIKWMMLQPEKVAQRVAHAVERRKQEIDLPLFPALGVKLLQLFPRLTDGLAGRIINKK